MSAHSAPEEGTVPSESSIHTQRPGSGDGGAAIGSSVPPGGAAVGSGAGVSFGAGLPVPAGVFVAVGTAAGTVSDARVHAIVARMRNIASNDTETGFFISTSLQSLSAQPMPPLRSLPLCWPNNTSVPGFWPIHSYCGVGRPTLFDSCVGYLAYPLEFLANDTRGWDR